MPNHLDIRLQRLDVDVIDAEAFFRELLINGAVTLREESQRHPDLYGVSWSEDENLIADQIHHLWRRMEYSRSEILSCEKFDDIDIVTITNVLQKMESSDECFLKAQVPGLTKYDQEQLLQYRDKDKRKNKSKQKQKLNTPSKPKVVKNSKKVANKTITSSPQKLSNNRYIDIDLNENSTKIQNKTKNSKTPNITARKVAHSASENSPQREMQKSRDENIRNNIDFTVQHRIDGTTGFQNYGVNVCFANSVVQMLYRIETLRSLLTTYAGSNSVIYGLKDWFYEVTMCPEYVSSISTENLVRRVIPPAFVFGQQNCASEFLVYILDQLRGDLHFQGHRLFEKVKVTTRCEHKFADGEICNHVPKPQTEEIIVIQLTIPSTIMVPRTTSLLHANRQENADDYVCDGCKFMGECKNTREILHESKYLFIQMNIFRNRIVQNEFGVVNAIYEKSSKPITVENIIVVDNIEYNLLGFVCHDGGNSANCGHYVAIIADQGSLTLYNDANVCKMNQTQFRSTPTVNNRQPYLLLYERNEINVNQSNQPGCSTSHETR